MLGCNFCGGEAVYLRHYSKERFCKKCYIRVIEKQVQHTITRHRMLKPDDKIVVALSGGKDSVSLLHLMSRIEERFPRSELLTVTIDEGIRKYRSDALRIARESSQDLGVEHYVYSFKSLYGHTLDEIADAARQRGRRFICSYCGILRRKALNVAARDLGATKIVTAHNLDDEIQSMVMNFLRGDLNRISGSDKAENHLGLIPKVKPLSEIPERDIALYAFIRKLGFQSFCCPYTESSLRSDVRGFLNMLEHKHSGMKYTTYRSLEKIRTHLTYRDDRSLRLCELCSEPTSREVCMACQILKELGS